MQPISRETKEAEYERSKAKNWLYSSLLDGIIYEEEFIREHMSDKLTSEEINEYLERVRNNAT